DWGKEVHVKTAKGTDIKFSIRGRRAISNSGDYSKPGTGGNIPVGEVYIAPVEGTASGKLVIDGTIKHRWGATIVQDPVTILIEKGKITEIRGGFEAKLLERTFDWAAANAKNKENVRVVGEFGIGTNPKAKLIGATILDEKTINTAHIAFGSNYWFGGDIYSILHVDQIFKDPIIEVDGKKINI
ncbi:MAG: aminopeptidase, partial [Nanoarchaeota archaeon]|nr:aminopeptidase [Nanoarchaeota archaeon]